jgi:hypothetical protein
MEIRKDNLFQLGKIKSKFIISEILNYALSEKNCYEFLHTLSTNSRTFVIRNKLYL